MAEVVVEGYFELELIYLSTITKGNKMIIHRKTVYQHSEVSDKGMKEFMTEVGRAEPAGKARQNIQKNLKAKIKQAISEAKEEGIKAEMNAAFPSSGALPN